MFKDNGERDGWLHRKRESWAINQNGNGRNLPMRITVTTPEGIRHMTIHVEGDSRLYLYEGTGDGQSIVKPCGTKSQKNGETGYQRQEREDR